MSTANTARTPKCEMVSDSRPINLVNFAFIPQVLTSIHVLFAFVYGGLALATALPFDFLGMRDIWCSVYLALIVLQAGGLVLYWRRMRRMRHAGQTQLSHLPPYVVGKPMVHAIKVAQVFNFVMFAVLTWFSVQFVQTHAADKIELADVTVTFLVFYLVHFVLALFVLFVAAFLMGSKPGARSDVTSYHLIIYAATTILFIAAFLAILFVRGERVEQYTPAQPQDGSTYIPYMLHVALFTGGALVAVIANSRALGVHIYPLVSMTEL